MRALPFARSVPRALASRAALLWALVRTFVGVAFFLMRSAAMAGGVAATPHPSPVLIVVLCTGLGLIDMRRRGEEMLWTNLGISRTQLALVFGGTATTGEILLALVRR